MKRDLIERLLLLYKPIIDSRSVEYFSRCTWERLPTSWKHFIETISVLELIDIVNYKKSNIIQPLSLLCLKTLILDNTYSRDHVKSPTELKTFIGNYCVTEESTFTKITSNGLLRKRIKLKKQHEIDRLVEFIRQIVEINDNVKYLIDIGAGVGHLSRMVSLNLGLSVMAVEGDEQFTISAHSLDEEIMKKPETFTGNCPKRFTTFVTDDLSENIDKFCENGESIMVGLHTCGDFASTILNVFKKSQKARTLILIGCCYHKQFQCFHFYNPNNSESITESSEGLFLLSNKWKGLDLGYISREMACHMNENLAKLHENEPNISRYARAHLEYWISTISEAESDRNIGLCPVNCIPGKTTFREYIQKSMAKRGSHLIETILMKMNQLSPGLLERPVSTLDRQNFDKMDIIRMIFAPLIESCIIDDRVEYLKESGYNVNVIPLFDPKISPRNLAIFANK